MAGQKDVCSSSPARTPKLQLSTEQPLTGECWIPPEKKKSHVQQAGRRGETAFRIKPHTHQRCSKGSNKTMCIPGDPKETEPDLSLSPAEVWVSSGLLQGQGLWVQQTWVWHKPSWRRSPLTSKQSCQNLHQTGEQDPVSPSVSLSHQEAPVSLLSFSIRGQTE